MAEKKKVCIWKRSLDDLPGEIMTEIFLHLDFLFLMRSIDVVCQRFHFVVHSPNFVETLCRHIKRTFTYTDLPSSVRDFEVFKKEYLRLMNKNPIEYLENAINELYSDQDPIIVPRIHINTNLDGPSLKEFRVYRGKSEKGEYFWHYLSVGLTSMIREEDLGQPSYSKDPEDPMFFVHTNNRREVYFPAEYSLKLCVDHKCNSFEEMGKCPPEWVLDLLSNISDYQFGSQRPFLPGHYIPCNGPIKAPSDTQNTLLETIAFRSEPKIPIINTFNLYPSSIGFLECCPLTKHETDTARMWSTCQVVGLIYPEGKDACFHLYRKDALDEAKMKKVQRGMKVDGSQCSSLNFLQNCKIRILEKGKRGRKKHYIEFEIWRRFYLTLMKVLRSRVKFGNELLVNGLGNKRIVIRPVENEEEEPKLLIFEDECPELVVLKDAFVLGDEEDEEDDEVVRVETEDYVLKIVSVTPILGDDRDIQTVMEEYKKLVEEEEEKNENENE